MAFTQIVKVLLLYTPLYTSISAESGRQSICPSRFLRYIPMSGVSSPPHPPKNQIWALGFPQTEKDLNVSISQKSNPAPILLLAYLWHFPSLLSKVLQHSAGNVRFILRILLRGISENLIPSLSISLTQCASYKEIQSLKQGQKPKFSSLKKLSFLALNLPSLTLVLNILEETSQLQY